VFPDLIILAILDEEHKWNRSMQKRPLVRGFLFSEKISLGKESVTRKCDGKVLVGVITGSAICSSFIVSGYTEFIVT
jgi:hypothetical protein